MNGKSAPYLGTDYQIEVAETASGEIEQAGGLWCLPLNEVNVFKCCGIGILRERMKGFSLAWRNTYVSSA